MSIHICGLFNYESISPCQWALFPQTRTQLLPDIRVINCSVVDQFVPNETKFELVESFGTVRGKQTNKIIDSVTLDTGGFGVLFNLMYRPEKNLQRTLGLWCGWNNGSVVPVLETDLLDSTKELHVKPDGGIVFRTNWTLDAVPRGLAYVLCGLGGMQHSSRVLGKELLSDGWVVVYVFTTQNTPDYGASIDLQSKSSSHQYAAAAIELFDAKYCQVIEATQAIRELMENQFPTLHTSPIVLIGISAGALQAPAVYHTMKDDVNAVVLVAGGANMFDIVQEGAFTKWSFSHDDGIPFNKDDLQTIGTAYLDQLSRDPYHLAPNLPKDRTLIVHAKYDAVVPAINGDLLWERAGKPERWIYSSGHLGLFMTFDQHAEDIVNWIGSVLEDTRSN